MEKMVRNLDIQANNIEQLTFWRSMVMDNFLN